MHSFTIHRKSVCLLLVILAISLASLGVRLPWVVGLSSTSGKPKLRPRAIIENQIKTCKQVIKKISTFIAIIRQLPAITINAFLISNGKLNTIIYPPTVFTGKSSRAPPEVG